MNKSEKIRVIKLRNRIYNSEENREVLLKELYAILPKEGENEVLVTNAIARLYYEEKEYGKAKTYYKRALKKVKNLSSLLGLCKISIYEQDMPKALEYLQLYKVECEEENVFFDTAIMESLLKHFLFNEPIKISNPLFYFNIPLQNVYEPFHMLMDCLNEKRYEEAKSILSKLEEQKEKKKVYVDFSLLKFMILFAQKKDRNYFYTKLESALEKKDYESILYALKEIVPFSLQKRETVFYALFVLAKNGYGKEVLELLKQIKLITKVEIEFIKVIENAIVNQKKSSLLTEEQQIYSKEAQKQGRFALVKQDFKKALAIYEDAFKNTKEPLYLYYIGKTYYKLNDLKNAEKYLNAYQKVGEEKLSKANLYLFHIYKITGKRKEMTRCADNISFFNRYFKEDWIVEIKKDQEENVFTKKKKNIEE